MSKRSLIIIALVAVIGLGAGAALFWRAESPAGADSAQADVGGPFELVNQDGQTVDESILEGRWSVVFFGFTYCPDICPSTLQAVAAAQEQLGPRGADLQTVFISVDPERDTPEQLKTYLSLDAFPDDVVGLTGAPEQIEQVAKAYYVYYRKSGEGPDYTVDHSTAAYLMDPQGRFNRVLAYGLSPDEMARLIRTAMQEG
ncbi:SCO family protein [Phenylobacterium sp.]|jgi:protein SCO1/2|uniref:SCO family protein n=1 Tax=Phenylobacterium sp. TaxID=1871053 RepID=UPI000C96CE29|nr:SCO family protein [Phenylobacterium sp.]MAK80527.1 photosynthetic protein synthase I [Phenylobacterium sp.]|tara:strand:+ start:25086 stop:25685 length:600 start_codon:yes stop_codon:yes gene_type:complete